MGFFYRLFNRANNFGLHNVFIKCSMDGWMDGWRNKRELKAINGMVNNPHGWMSSCIPSFSLLAFWLYHVNKISQFRIVNCPCATNTHHQFLHHENVCHRPRNFRVLCTIELFPKYPQTVGMGPSFGKTGDKIKKSLDGKLHTRKKRKRKKRWPNWFPHLN